MSELAPDREPPSESRGNGHLLGLLVLVVAPLLLRLWPIEHGQPDNFVPDTHIVNAALGMASEKDLVPEVGKYSTYPNLLPYALLPLYGAQYALGRATGSWSGVESYKDHLLENPGSAHRIARWLVALLAAAAPWVVFRGARAAGLRGGAWVAAWLVATGLLHVHFSVQERPWAPLVTFMALAAWPAALHVRDGRARWLYLSGGAAALSFACHQAGAAALGIAGLAWLSGPLGWRGVELRRRLGQGVACVALFAGVAVAVGHPYLLVHGRTNVGDVAAGDALGDAGGWVIRIGGQAIVLAVSGETFARLSRALVGYDPVLVLLVLVGLVPALRARATRPAALFTVLWAAFFMTNQNDHVRYLLPVVVLGAWPAGLAAERIGRHGVGRAVLAVALAFPLVQTLRLGWVLRQEDTRAEAAERLAELGQSARIAIDCYGPPVPKNLASLQRVSGWRDLYAREKHRHRYFTEFPEVVPPRGYGLDVVPIEDLCDFDYRHDSSWVEERHVERFGDDPNGMLAELGVTHVLLVDRTPDDGNPPLLVYDGPAQENGEGPRPKMRALELEDDPLWTIHPAGPGGSARDATLPTELSFALTAIWSVGRPGPKLELYRFAP